MTTYLDLLPLELTEIIYEKKNQMEHKIEMKECFGDIHKWKIFDWCGDPISIRTMVIAIKENKEEEEEDWTADGFIDDGRDYIIDQDHPNRYIMVGDPPN